MCVQKHTCEYYTDNRGRAHLTFESAFTASTRNKLADSIAAEIDGLFGQSEATYIAAKLMKEFTILPRK